MLEHCLVPKRALACLFFGGILGIPGCGGGSGGGDQNGAPARDDVLAPVQVTAALTFTEIGVAYGHVCGVATNGGTYCWGKNEHGVLGSAAAMSVCVLPISEGGFPCTDTPVVVEGAPPLVQVGGSPYHSCGLDSGGSAYCWGSGLGGRLGDGTEQISVHPVPVAGGHVFTSLSVGGDTGMSCGTASNGSVLCWGIGILGNGTTEYSTVPIAASAPEPIVAASVGGIHACALTGNGHAYCWGNNWFGQLGIGSAGDAGGVAQSLVPVSVTGELSFVSISAGGMHTCGLADSGVAYCWGAGFLVGNGSDIGYVPTPVAVSTNELYVEITSGLSHTCALTEQGMARCWGDNVAGQLGNGTTTGHFAPQAVSQGNVRFQRVVAGVNTCAIALDGTAYCWGSNAFGQSGRPGYEVLR